MIFLKLFGTFFQIGLFTFGGGYAMISMIKQNVVDFNHWLTESQLTEFIGISESTPGPFAINIATFIGMQEGGFLGALSATLGVVLPSFIIIYIIAKLFGRMQGKKSRLLDATLVSVRPIVVGLIGVAFIDILCSVCFGGFNIASPDSYQNIMNTDFVAVAIAVIMLVLTRTVKKFSPIMVVISSALLGMAFYAIEHAVTG